MNALQQDLQMQSALQDEFSSLVARLVAAPGARPTARLASQHVAAVTCSGARSREAALRATASGSRLCTTPDPGVRRATSRSCEPRSCSGRKPSQPSHQSLSSVDVTLLDPTAGFEALLRLFDHPATALPVSPRPRLFTRRRFQASEQDLFQRFFPSGRLAFPHAHHPDGQRVFAATRVIPGRQQRGWPKADLERRLPGLSPVTGGYVKGLLALARPSTYVIQQMPAGLFFRLDSALLGGADHPVGLSCQAAPAGVPICSTIHIQTALSRCARWRRGERCSWAGAGTPSKGCCARAPNTACVSGTAPSTV
jgi:hypothetical protein